MDALELAPLVSPLRYHSAMFEAAAMPTHAKYGIIMRPAVLLMEQKEYAQAATARPKRASHDAALKNKNSDS